MADSKPTDADWLNFEKSIEIFSKSDQVSSAGSSSSGTDLDFDKICVVISYSNSSCLRHSYSFEFFVYVIDIVNNSPSVDPQIQSLKPVVCWDIDQINFQAFATLGSKLCMFGELVVLTPGGALLWGYDMYYYDIKNLKLDDPDSPLRLTKESLEKGPRMKGRKPYPLAVMIGDSMICVFASFIYTSWKKYGGPNFELLYTDTKTGQLEWKELPEPLKYDTVGEDSVFIRSYCVHRSCLIIDIVGQGIFGINVDHLPEPKWFTLNRSESTDFPFEGMFAMVDHQILCDGFYIAKRNHLHQLGIDISRCRKSLVISPGAACFDDRSNTFCIAQRAFDCSTDDDDDDDNCCTPTDDKSYLLIDIVKLPEVVTSKSFTFQLPKYRYSNYMKIVTCLLFKNASRNNKNVAQVDQWKMKMMKMKMKMKNQNQNQNQNQKMKMKNQNQNQNQKVANMMEWRPILRGDVEKVHWTR